MNPIYLITFPGSEPFFSNVFDADNHFTAGMTVYWLPRLLYTTDGKTWLQIQVDHF